MFTPDQNPIKEKLEVQHLKTEEDFELNAIMRDVVRLVDPQAVAAE